MKKLKLKMILDFAMIILWIVLMIYSFTGSFWHEFLGISLFAIFILHLFLNRKWITSMSKEFFSLRAFKKFNINTLRYIINIVLLPFMGFTVIGGIFISKDILTSISVGAESYMLFSSLHNLIAYLTLILTSIHIGLHGKMIMSFFSKIFNLNKINRTRKIVCNLIAVAVIIYGLKSSFFYPLPSIETSNIEEETANVNLTNQSSTIINLDSKPGFYASATQTPQDGETLNDFLSRLVCTGCAKRCPLSNPRCGKGVSQATNAKTVYNEYISSQTTSNNTSSPSEITSDNLSNSNNSSNETSSNETVDKSDMDNGNLTSENSSLNQTSNNPNTEITTSGNDNITSDYPIDENNENETNVFDIGSIMGLYICSTYYILKFFKL